MAQDKPSSVLGHSCPTNTLVLYYSLILCIHLRAGLLFCISCILLFPPSPNRVVTIHSAPVANHRFLSTTFSFSVFILSKHSVILSFVIFSYHFIFKIFRQYFTSKAFVHFESVWLSFPSRKHYDNAKASGFSAT